MILEFVTKCLWVFFALTRPFSDKVLDLVYRVLAGKPRLLPPVKRKLLLMSATELARAVRKREISSEELVSTYIDRIQEVNPVINFCVDQRFEDALSDARGVDQMLRDCPKTEGQVEREWPLLGVPFTCKEILGVKGLGQTMGLMRFQDRKAPVDAEVVALYKKAGAIPLVVTNIPTISMWWQTSNALFGMTANPFNSHRMVGGSSGGEAAAIASGASVIGLGTDIGGSIRIPACFCGIYGHKPSRGIISNHRTTPSVNMKLDPFRSTGPMCRYAQDLTLLVKILSGEEGAKKLRLDRKVDFSKINLFFVEGFPGLLSPIPAIKSTVRKAVQHFEIQFGIRARRLEFEELSSAFDIWMNKFLEADGAPLLPDLVDERGNLDWVREMLRSLLGLSEYDIPILYFAAIAKRRKDRAYLRCLDLYRRLEEKFDEHLRGPDSLLIVPTFPEVPPHTAMSIPKVENTVYTSIFNTLGYPATQVPAGIVGGLPIGVQAVASRYNDHLTLAAAVELERLFGGWQSPCEIRVNT